MSRGILLLGTVLLSCAPSAPGQEKDKVRLAFICNNSAAFWNIVERGCEQAAKEHKVDLEFRRPDQVTPAAQKKIVESLLEKGIQGLAITANDPNGSEYLKKIAAKVPLLAADNDLFEGQVRRCYLGTHNYQMGRAAGALIKKAVPRGGKIAIFVGAMDTPNAIERRQGILDYLAGKDQQEMKDTTPANAANVALGDYVLIGTILDLAREDRCRVKAEDVLLIHPDVACLVGLWEYNAPALRRAVRNAKAKTAIVGFDENFETLEGIQKGEIAGTVVQNPHQLGYESIKILADLARGKKDVLKRKDIDAQGRIFIPSRIVVRNPGQEKIGNVETLDVDVFFAQLKKWRDR